jgi:hypothetical protein
MSSTISCPKCFKPVSMPAGVEASAWVRCPLCMSQFPFQTVLDGMPPALVVIAAPSDEDIPAMMDDAAEEEMSFEPAEESSFEAVSMDEPSFEASEAEAAVSSAAFAAVSDSPSKAGAHSGSHGVVDLGEDEDTLPAMESGSLTPAGALNDYHKTHGFREAPDDEEDSGVLELQAEENAWQTPPVTSSEPPVAVAAPAVRRRQKAKRNPIFEVSKFVGGSVGGLAIGYAVLMWGFKQDPLKLAEILPTAIVPASLQSPYRTTVQNIPAQTPPQNQNQKDPWAPPGGNSPPTNTNPEPTPMPMGDSPMPMEEPLDASDSALPGVDPNPPMPTGNQPDGGTTAPMPIGETPTPMPGDTPAPMPMPGETPIPGETLTPTPPADPLMPTPDGTEPKPMPSPEPPMTETKPMPMDETNQTPPAADSPMPTPFDSPTPEPTAPMDESSKTTTMKPVPDEGFPPVPEPMPPQEEPRVGPKSDKKVTLEQVNQAMAAAGDSAKAFYSAAADLPDTERKKLLANYFKNFASLAESITLVNDKPENAKAARAAALTVLQSVATDMPKLNQIGKVAGFWKKRTDRNTDGIILAGRVQETTPLGKLFRTRLLMLGHDQPSEAEMIVVSADDPAIKHGEIAVVIGMIVGAPAINLHDYEGTDDSVVWGSAIGPVQIDPLAP